MAPSSSASWFSSSFKDAGLAPVSLCRGRPPPQWWKRPQHKWAQGPGPSYLLLLCISPHYSPNNTPPKEGKETCWHIANTIHSTVAASCEDQKVGAVCEKCFPCSYCSFVILKLFYYSTKHLTINLTSRYYVEWSCWYGQETGFPRTHSDPKFALI